MTTKQPATPLHVLLLAQFRAAHLYRKWVGRGPVELDRLRAIVKHERRMYENGTLRCSRGLLREIRAEQKVIGSLCKLAGVK